ncbi:hypothetical protein AVEN_247890-1 [Araneus ventricosus]|uniref:Uncharacterized protein n=1 Tax=Araneus ventricosus TaxID=182803 RepID=A0A4Y2HU52_ARAVE|nr:hypothetical protein AVEN_247890-1 [Araneus ventricosus]
MRHLHISLWLEYPGRIPRSKLTIGGHRCLVVGRMAGSVDKWKERETKLHPFRYLQNGGIERKEESGVNNRLGSLERVSDFGSAEKSCVIRSLIKNFQIDSDFGLQLLSKSRFVKFRNLSGTPCSPVLILHTL